MKNKFLLLLISFIFLLGLIPMASAQWKVPMSKWEYYDKLCQDYGHENKLTKPSGFNDRKYGRFDVGKIGLEINNANRLGYSREMLTFEYPLGSGITYNWCETLIVGGIVNGQKRVSNGARGALGEHENQFEPLPGYDSGIGDNGLAMSNKPVSWASVWPADAGAVGSSGFPGVYEDGEVAANAEAIWMAVDDDPDCHQLTPLHIKTLGRGLQFSSILAEDMIVFKYYITNTGTDTIKDCYVGVHTDMDAPEEGDGEWMDDYAKFISIEEDSILGNFLYLWDGDDKSEGYIEKGVAWQGLKMLETPKGADGKEIGLTTLCIRSYDTFYGTPSQAALYDFMASGITPIHNIEPHTGDWTETPNTYGPDVTSMHASGPFDLAPGETVTFTFANIFGVNKADLLANTKLAQTVYDYNYKTATASTQPNVRAVVGDRQVTLYWDADPSEGAIDEFTGTNAFEGYKIYRSTDRGLSWGEKITNSIGALVGYIPIAQCDLINGITGNSELDPLFYLGDDTGLFHKFTDKNLMNGVEYWYAVCAYDHDDLFEGTVPVPPMENPRLTNPDYLGDNTVAVFPQAKPSGYESGSITDVTHVSGISAGTVNVQVIDYSQVVSGTYEVTFSEDPDQGTMAKVTSNGNTVMEPYPVVAPDDPGVDKMPVFNGLRLIAINAQSGIDVDATAVIAGDSLFWDEEWDFEYEAGSGLSDDYEIRFTEGGSIAFQYSEPYGPVQVPYEVWNITTNMQINSDVYDRGDESYDIGGGDWIFPVNTPYDGAQYISAYPDDYNYYFRFSSDASHQMGDIFRIITFKPFTSNDVYQFTATGATISPTTKDLDDIKVVPNPYAITSVYEDKLEPWIKELQFHFLPEKCTIRIFTISGELVQILHHEPGSDGYRGSSVEAWDLWNYNDQEVAFGVYIFHIKAEGIGEKLGKFAIIK